MAAIKILVIGANAANVTEIKQVVVSAIGGGARIMTADVTNYRQAPPADLYVCLINRKEEMETAFGLEKVAALTLVPPTEYFLRLSRIDAGEKVLIFNNSVSGTRVLVDRITRYGLNNLHYEILPYDEIDHDRAVALLQGATCIIGGIAYVGPGSALYTRFGADLPPNVTVLVSPPRSATAESISKLTYIYSSLYHKAVMERLKRLSSIDSLTSLPNRRSFDDYLKNAWRKAKRQRQPLALAMIDIDYFKYYNDLNGHVEGDRCLQRIARTVRKVLKPYDGFFARYGGEEFVAMLPKVSMADGYDILEKVRKTVVQQEIRNPFSPVSPMLTISIGLTVVVPAEGLELKDLLVRADQALYLAKQRGRNQVVCKNFK
ncbi:MAG: diguanylate cyclase [Sporomusaceae bacterium]|nr:diguanylate cyclase [Sporomusaceae bacterium]